MYIGACSKSTEIFETIYLNSRNTRTLLSIYLFLFWSSEIIKYIYTLLEKKSFFFSFSFHFNDLQYLREKNKLLFLWSRGYIINIRGICTRITY